MERQVAMVSRIKMEKAQLEKRLSEVRKPFTSA